MSIVKKFRAIEAEMNQMFFERREEIRGLLVALVAKAHIIFLGPPGTAKSEMTEDLCSRFTGAAYFRWLMTRTSPPEELYGPISLKALENDSYRRVTTGKLPEAFIAFLDEIFKSNSAILNSLLTVMNEGLFFNDGQPVKLPLQIVVGASNEMPEDKEELGALWDRFLLRYETSYIKDPRNFEALLKRNGGPSTRTMLTEKDLVLAQVEADQVTIDKIIPQLFTLRQKVAEMNIPVSDRRWRQCLALIKAYAWLEGRGDASDADLEILAHALWQDPEQRLQIRQAIMALANPLDQEALSLYDEAMEIWQNAVNASEENQTNAGREANTKLKRIAKRLKELREAAQNTGKSDVRISEVLKQVLGWNEEIINVCLGIEI